jgi:cystathionine beta-lyase/cystathionine gamma-synthase
VVHSLTKGLSGFGTDMGGAVVTRGEFVESLLRFRKDFGGTLAPQTAWHMLVYGLPTLSLRIPRQQENALAVARFLENHREVDFVRYPGLESFPQYGLAERQMRDYHGDFAPGIVLYFALKGKTPGDTVERARRFIDFIADNSYAITLAVSLGQLRTLIEHPASMTHSSYGADGQKNHGFDPGGIRLAVGVEDADDIIRDLDEALLATHT